MNFTEMQQRARSVRKGFADYEVRTTGREWTAEETMLGLVGDVGDLAKLMQAAAGVRPTADLEAKIGHELADCLWSILTLADRCDVDLEAAFGATMKQLETWLDAQNQV